MTYFSPSPNTVFFFKVRDWFVFPPHVFKPLSYFFPSRLPIVWIRGVPSDWWQQRSLQLFL